MSDQVIARFRKNEVEECVISVRNFEGTDFVDFRTYFGARGQDTRPTKKGLTIPIAMYGEFRRSIDLLDSVMKEAGWHT
jgi:Transcriptional Coactivator p15 (PC4)